MAPARDDDGTPTPWWERKEAELRDRGASDASCSISSSETYSCRTAPDENGVMRRKCERVVRRFRMCPGRAPEELESTREETNEEHARDRLGTGFEAEFFKTFGATDGEDGLAVGGFSMPPLGFPFGALFGGDARNGNARDGGGGGAMTFPVDAMFRGFFDLVRELERLEHPSAPSESGSEDGRRAAQQPPVATSEASAGDASFRRRTAGERKD